MARYKHNQLKSKNYDEIQKLFDKEMKRVNTFVNMDSDLMKESETRAEGNDGDDVTIDATPLSVKIPIVDYKIYQEGKKSFFQIIRADGKTQMYLTFSKMLKNFDKEDLEVLWRIVKARFKKTEPVDYMDTFLHLNLKTMFEHHVEENQVFTINIHHDGIFIASPLRYVHGDLKQIIDIDFEGIKELKIDSDVQDFVRVGYENKWFVDLYVKHFDYDVMDFINEEANGVLSGGSSDEYYSSDEIEEFDDVDFHTEGEENVGMRYEHPEQLKQALANYGEFARLWDYRQTLLESNLGSTCKLEVEEVSSGSTYFKRFYICFKGLKDGWLDGCFLKHTCRGDLLISMGRDANNQMYPIAWAIVKVENIKNWSWILSLLHDDLNLQQGTGLTLISDSHKVRLLDVVGDWLPNAEHRKLLKKCQSGGRGHMGAESGGRGQTGAESGGRGGMGAKSGGRGGMGSGIRAMGTKSGGRGGRSGDRATMGGARGRRGGVRRRRGGGRGGKRGGGRGSNSGLKLMDEDDIRQSIEDEYMQGLLDEQEDLRQKQEKEHQDKLDEEALQ
ncbi:splicing factor [Tanacetum coccineum]|uniref:Splicing factor n=1 Tax=Tanacetum coccineum TaxID=301880 RepID=A0ABQ5FNY1_9ASTR